MHLISISGPPVSGKTTLWTDLRTRLRNDADFVPDIPRQALEALGPERAEADIAAFQHYVGYTQLVAEERQPSLRLRILDKSVLDAVAYWNVLVGGPRPVWGSLPPGPRYVVVLLCEREPGMMPQAPVQELHESIHRRIAGEVQEHASHYSQTVVHLAGNRIERADQAWQALTEVGVLPATQRSRRSIAPAP